jgi:hypothetical protein
MGMDDKSICKREQTSERGTMQNRQYCILLQGQVIGVKSRKFKMVNRLLDLEPMQGIKSSRRLSDVVALLLIKVVSKDYRNTIGRRGAK